MALSMVRTLGSTIPPPTLDSREWDREGGEVEGEENLDSIELEQKQELEVEEVDLISSIEEP